MTAEQDNVDGSTWPSLLSRAALLLLVLWFGYFATTAYYSDYYFVAAGRGDKTLGEFERLLRTSHSYNPSNGRTSMQLAALLTSEKKYSEAAQLQHEGLQSYRTVSVYEQLGAVQEKLAETALAGTSTTQELDAARDLYEKAARIYPGNISALERLITLAYRRGDDASLDKYAAELSRADALNMNGVYLRALAAQRRRDFITAAVLLQRVVAAGEPAAGALYNRKTVADQLRQLANEHNIHQ